MIKEGVDEKRIKRTNNLVYVWLAASSQQLAARRAALWDGPYEPLATSP